MQTITEETKKEVVKLHIPDGRTIASFAAYYEICHAAVSNWIRSYREECQTNDAAKSENELMQEVRQLRQKLAEAEKENGFQKKQWHFLRRKSISNISIYRETSKKFRNPLAVKTNENISKRILQLLETSQGCLPLRYVYRHKPLSTKKDMPTKSFQTC
jgi:transposase